MGETMRNRKAKQLRRLIRRAMCQDAHALDPLKGSVSPDRILRTGRKEARKLAQTPPEASP